MKLEIPTIRLSDRYKPLPTQRVAHSDRHTYRGYVGGWGSGKTRWVCEEAKRWAVLRPGTEILIGRQYYTELKDTTMRVFFEEAMPKELIQSWKPSDLRVILKPIGPSGKQTHIIFRALEDYQKLKSMNLGGFGIDEADETTEDTFVWLGSRLRHPLGPNRGWLAANDEGRNWIYHLFHPAGNRHNPDLYKLFVAPTRENTYLPPGTIERFYHGFSQDMIDKYLEPKFQLIGGAIYPEWKVSDHVIDPIPIRSEWPVYRVIDPGMTNTTAAMLYTIFPTGEMVVIAEYYEADVTVDQAAAGIQEMTAPYDDQLQYSIIDPAAFKKNREKYGRHWSIADDYNEHGIFCLPGNNDVRGGILRVKMLLNQRKLLVFRTCKELQEEFADYEWRKTKAARFDENKKERPKKVRDHLMDCLRYAAADHSEGPAEPEPEREWWQPTPQPRDWMVQGIPGATRDRRMSWA